MPSQTQINVRRLENLLQMDLKHKTSQHIQDIEIEGMQNTTLQRERVEEINEERWCDGCYL